MDNTVKWPDKEQVDNRAGIHCLTPGREQLMPGGLGASYLLEVPGAWNSSLCYFMICLHRLCA